MELLIGKKTKIDSESTLPPIFKMPMNSYDYASIKYSLKVNDYYTFEKKYKTKSSALNNSLTLKFEYFDLVKDPSLADRAISDLIKLGISPTRIICCFPNGDYDIKQVRELVGTYNKYYDKGVICCFEHCSMSEALTFNKEAKILVDRINNMRIDDEPLSPIEKFAIVYHFVADRYYNENHENKLRSRNFISAYTGEYTVCVGYAQLLAKLCNEVGINCHHQAIYSFRENKPDTPNHANNMVMINDPKYRIKGVFYCDSCWDSKKVYRDPTFKYFMIPYQDLDKTSFDKKLEVEYSLDENSLREQVSQDIGHAYKEILESGKILVPMIYTPFANIVFTNVCKRKEVQKKIAKSADHPKKREIFEKIVLEEFNKAVELLEHPVNLDYKTFIEDIGSVIARAETKLYGERVTKKDIFNSTLKEIVKNKYTIKNTGKPESSMTFDPAKSEHFMGQLYRDYQLEEQNIGSVTRYTVKNINKQ